MVHTPRGPKFTSSAVQTGDVAFQQIRKTLLFAVALQSNISPNAKCCLAIFFQPYRKLPVLVTNPKFGHNFIFSKGSKCFKPNFCLRVVHYVNSVVSCKNHAKRKALQNLFFFLNAVFFTIKISQFAFNIGLVTTLAKTVLDRLITGCVGCWLAIRCNQCP